MRIRIRNTDGSDKVLDLHNWFFLKRISRLFLSFSGTISPVLYIPLCLITVEPVRNLALSLFPGKERTLWQQMLDRPNFWVEGSLGLRPVPEAARQDK
jgi:hypothetical protein